MDAYQEIRFTCLHDYRHGPFDLSTHPPSPFDGTPAARYLVSLSGRASKGNSAPLKIELALRYLSGWETRGTPDPDSALQALQPLTELKLETFPRGRLTEILSADDLEPVRLIAQVHSIAAYAYYLKYITPADARIRPSCASKENLIHNLLTAVRHAHVAAKMQFITRGVLWAGFAFQGIAETVGVPLTRFKHYTPLWHAMEQRELAMFGRAGDITFRTGYFYEGECGLGSSCWETRNLEPCSGPCPAHLKPKYCSRECRKEYWPLHKGLCDAGTALWPMPTLGCSEYPERYMQALDALHVPGLVVQIEVLPEVEEGAEWPTGRVSWWKLEGASPYEPGKTVTYVEKCYD
ncbi:hypothetical protein GY45DRAFT_126022 [Cubamyces sp. BRFM 1775]|nr:hypothetical protein GY45DRAFT_126022 [Cubamyces sp. BRFM 1775]